MTASARSGRGRRRIINVIEAFSGGGRRRFRDKRMAISATLTLVAGVDSLERELESSLGMLLIGNEQNIHKRKRFT